MTFAPVVVTLEIAGALYWALVLDLTSTWYLVEGWRLWKVNDVE